MDHDDIIWCHWVRKTIHQVNHIKCPSQTHNYTASMQVHKQPHIYSRVPRPLHGVVVWERETDSVADGCR